MSSSSDEGLGQSAVLPVARFTTFDPAVAPASGAEYLRRVQLQAAGCEKIVVSRTKRLPAQPSDPVLLILSAARSGSDFHPCPPSHALPAHVQRELVAHFSQLRTEVDERRDRLSDDQRIRMRHKFPALSQHAYWKKYCLRVDTLSETSSSSSSDEELAGATKKKRATKTRTRTKAQPPTRSRPNMKLLLSLDQWEMLTLLQLHTKWIRELGVTDDVSFWIYCMLTCIEKPLASDAYAVLRDVSRAVSAVRRELLMHPDHGHHDGEESSLSACHSLICLIGRYFQQLDMIDE